MEEASGKQPDLVLPARPSTLPPGSYLLPQNFKYGRLLIEQPFFSHNETDALEGLKKIFQDHKARE
jgi:hypothetical protein